MITRQAVEALGRYSSSLSAGPSDDARTMPGITEEAVLFGKSTSRIMADLGCSYDAVQRARSRVRLGAYRERLT